MSDKQIKSRKRIADYGEVFTSEREVNAMLDLVKHETERIESRFLEPACGDGNFLAEILRRKLKVVKKKYRKSPDDYEKNAVLAASSIYGVDILMDNVIACRERLYTIWNDEYRAICKKEVNEDCQKSVKFILTRNIVCGNALTLKKVNENGNDTYEPIVFSEWSFVKGPIIQRSDYTFDRLLEGTDNRRDIFGERLTGFSDDESRQLAIFDDSENREGKTNDEGVFLKQYISNYRRVWEYGE